jgi:hypothetical protein
MLQYLEKNSLVQKGRPYGRAAPVVSPLSDTDRWSHRPSSGSLLRRIGIPAWRPGSPSRGSGPRASARQRPGRDEKKRRSAAGRESSMSKKGCDRETREGKGGGRAATNFSQLQGRKE